MTATSIVPWTCVACGAKFEAAAGAVCSRCNRLLCRRHFGLWAHLTWNWRLPSPGSSGAPDQRSLCADCLSSIGPREA